MTYRADHKTTMALRTLSEHVALEDRVIEKQTSGRRFSLGTKPVIRWIKGNGLDDQVTKAAIGQATRLFGSSVDYCLCTNDIDAARVRNILEWAIQPVEWWPISELDNLKLAEVLIKADCPPAYFGYWWKWFPERVRPNAPEWILDGDMVITAKPPWFEQWLSGEDVLRIAQDDIAPPTDMYGNYVEHVNLDLKLYSGLISLPPKVSYIDQFLTILQAQLLAKPHDGRKDMCEQGVTAAAFGKLDALPIPLYEFPFCKAFQNHIDFGIQGNKNQVWGYHFAGSFVMDNPHFERLTQEGIIFSIPKTISMTFGQLAERFRWLGNIGQWGIPGWCISDETAIQICIEAQAYATKEVLELGTSRGHLSAMLAFMGCKLTTVDYQDRGAIHNLAGLNVTVVIEDAVQFLMHSNKEFDLIVVDVHGNTPQDWARLKDPLIARVKRGSKLVINNATLYEDSEWKDETGVQWFLDQLPKNWHIKINKECLTGIATVSMVIESNCIVNPIDSSRSYIFQQIDQFWILEILTFFSPPIFTKEDQGYADLLFSMLLRGDSEGILQIYQGEASQPHGEAMLFYASCAYIRLRSADQAIEILRQLIKVKARSLYLAILGVVYALVGENKAALPYLNLSRLSEIEYWRGAGSIYELALFQAQLSEFDNSTTIDLESSLFNCNVSPLKHLHELNAFLPASQLYSNWSKSGEHSYFIFCDATYFSEHAYACAISIIFNDPEKLIHIHIVNPTEENRILINNLLLGSFGRLKITYETISKSPTYPVIYYSCCRFSRLAQFYLLDNVNYCMIDADTLILRNIDFDALAKTQDSQKNVVFTFKEHEPIWSKFPAAFSIYFKNSNSSELFLISISSFILKSIAAGKVRWFLDQIAIYLAFHFSKMNVNLVDSKFYFDDRFNEDSCIWALTNDKKNKKFNEKKALFIKEFHNKISLL